ncbi:carbohydrate kinase (thermoresistant glucokinase family) [Streptomyces sp. Amel2xB2]|nr:carbohydrate kinase (thermoresistant glucokinase family) [Streptomyces sp. Amel2xB2]
MCGALTESDSEVRMGSPDRRQGTGPSDGPCDGLVDGFEYGPDGFEGGSVDGLADDRGSGGLHRGVAVVMGVAGTGKTTVGALLAEALGAPYAEADSFHPPANVAKMTAGRPLDDSDREPWLDAIGAWASQQAESGGVVSCSALKRAYRDRLRAAAPHVFFVHLTGDRSLIARRMEQRRDHFMPLTLLDSQFAALEPLQPDEAGAAVPVGAGPEAVTRRALTAFRDWSAASGRLRAAGAGGPR